MNPIWTLVLTYNGLDDTRKCLTSLASQAATGHPILVVDNGSTDGTMEAVGREFPWAKLFRVEKNQGPSVGNNRGIEHAMAQGAGSILLLNNDTTAAPNLIDRMQVAAQAHPDFKVLGPVINYMDEPAVVMTDGVIFNPPGGLGFFARKEVPLRTGATPQVTPVDVVNGCCMLVAAEVFTRIGLFDEQFFIYHDETDFCLRAKQAGFQCGVISEQLVWHKGSSTFKVTGKRFGRYYDSRNLVYLLKKHDGAGYNGRGRLATAKACVKYLYFRYCHEREDGHDDAANAILEGLLDGLAGRQGQFAARRHPTLPALRAMFELLRHRPRLGSPAPSARS
jgi:GT2 family glycosyltransferase